MKRIMRKIKHQLIMKRHFLRSRVGFTLIELMVVISIISLLSSIVVASLAEAKDKARIARAEYFLSHIRGSQPEVGSWKFTFPTTGGIVEDRSQNGNTGQVFGGPIPCTDEGYRSGKVECDFSPGYIEIPKTTTSTLEFGPEDSFTLSAWIKTNTPHHGRIISSGHYTMSPGYVLQVTHNNISGGDLYAVAGIGVIGGQSSLSNSAVYVRSKKGGLADGKWHLITTIVDGPKKELRLYVDGVIAELEAVAGRPFGSGVGQACNGRIENDTVLFYGGCGEVTPSTETLPVCIGKTINTTGGLNCNIEPFIGEISEPYIFKDVINSPSAW